MSISLVALAVFVLLQALVYLGMAISATLLGIVGIIAAIALLIEGGPLLYNRYVGRRV